MKPVNILLVDDRVENLIALENILRDLDVAIFKAESGTEALERLLERQYACVLLDVQMPDMDGFEVARLLGENDDIKFTPIIFVTAYGEDAALMFRGYEQGAVDFLSKPLEPAVVRGKVQVFAELQRQRSIIEEQKEALTRLNFELKESNTDLQTFVHIASHDLKEPLRGVSGLCQLLVRKLDAQLTPKDKEIAKEIVAGTRRMDTLISDLLAYSKLRSDTIELGPADVSKALSEVQKDLRSLIDETSAKITCDELPRVKASETHLKLLLQNLIANAIHYRRPGVAPEIHLYSTRTGKDATIYVRDNGMGIDEQYFEKVFAVFQRFTRNPESPGTGLGLAICKRIIDRLGGKIWLESKVGAGTSFYFTVHAAD